MKTNFLSVGTNNSNNKLSPVVKYGVIFFCVIFGLILISIGVNVVKYFTSPYGVFGATDAEKIYDVAIKDKDTSICEKVHLIWLSDVTVAELKGACYVKYVKAYPKDNICSKIITRSNGSNSNDDSMDGWYNTCLIFQNEALENLK